MTHTHEWKRGLSAAIETCACGRWRNVISAANPAIEAQTRTTHYHINEHTPGYLPDSDEPYTVGTADEAREAIAQIVEDWRDERGQLDGESETIGISEDGLNAWLTDRSDYSHDLGRVAEAYLCVEAECEADTD